MANRQRYRRGPLNEIMVAKSGTVAIQIGDMVMINSSETLTPVTASGDYTALIGIAQSASPTTDTSATKIRVATIGDGTVFEFPLAVATAARGTGDHLKITAVQQLTFKTGTSLKATGTNVAAVIADSMDASAGTALVMFRKGYRITNAF